MKVRSEFDRICSIRTLVKPLDEQLLRTKANKKELLLFLKYPQLPLHNNMVEIDIRERVIKRKISMQNRSLEGLGLDAVASVDLPEIKSWFQFHFIVDARGYQSNWQVKLSKMKIAIKKSTFPTPYEKKKSGLILRKSLKGF